MWIAKNKDLIVLVKDTKEELEQALQFMVYTDVEETDIEYQLFNGQYLTVEEIEEKKQEHIKSLTCTKRVFALMLKELGVPYNQLKELIATNEDAQLEWDLCVELLRENPMLDLMAGQLGITSDQLDKLFQYANGEITIKEFKGNEHQSRISDISNDV